MKIHYSGKEIAAVAAAVAAAAVVGVVVVVDLQNKLDRLISNSK